MIHDLYNWLNCVDFKFHSNMLIRLLFIAKMPGTAFFNRLVQYIICFAVNNLKQQAQRRAATETPEFIYECFVIKINPRIT